MSNDRPDPDSLLARLQQREEHSARGKLKVFFGASPGVGKTYAMLESGRKQAKEGIDVVVGYVEPHVRPETQALVLGLDVLPRRQVEYRGRTMFEFDLEAALAKRPQLLLVDELAHTNAPGLTHAKRWQDVEQLLQAGINVYTTLNVQHLESLNDVVAQITAVSVRETIPDSVFESADEVEIVDIAPDELIERLQEGKVYLPEQAQRAIENFFRKGNLIALRELALRETAARVGDQALDYRHKHEVSTIWHTSDRLLVCVGSSPMSAKLIRAARRMSSGMRAEWTALSIEIDGSRVASPVERQRLEANLRLAEQLGATVATVPGVDFANAVLSYAQEHNITKIVIGKPRLARWQEIFRGAYVYDLIRRCGDIDIYVISGDDETLPRNFANSPVTPVSRRPYLWATLSIVACTLLSWGLSYYFEASNLVMFYLACVVGISLTWGRGPSILASFLSVAAFDLFFVPPYGTLVVSDTQYLFTFVVMMLTGLVISELAARVKSQSDAARNRERRTAALYDLTRALTALPTREAVAGAARQIIQTVLDVEASIMVPQESGGLTSADPSPQAVAPTNDEGVVKWVYEHRQSAGFGTGTLPGSEGLYLPLLVTGGIVGVLGVRPSKSSEPLESQQIQLLEAFAGQIAVALERCNLAIQAEHVRMQMETERMRNSLLSAVSHDLRTPLATITGAASMLIEGSEQLASQSRRDLSESILDEADRLNRLVANLLDMTRLDAGVIHLQRELQPIEEVVGVVLKRIERDLREHPINTHIPADLPPVLIDEVLIQQVLINLFDNAIKFSPVRASIDLSVKQANQNLIVEIADRGPGIPSGKERQIFDKFYRANATARVGSGIGLAICQGVVTLHGGTIVAENRHDGGATFRFTLPLEAK